MWTARFCLLVSLRVSDAGYFLFFFLFFLTPLVFAVLAGFGAPMSLGLLAMITPKNRNVEPKHKNGIAACLYSAEKNINAAMI